MHFRLYVTRALAAASGLLALGALLVTPAHAETYTRNVANATTPTNYGGYVVSDYDADILQARKNLDRFYGDRFTGYTAPGVSWINEAGGTATSCGNLDIDQGWKQAAFYCAADKVVYVDYSFLRYENQQYGYDGVMSIMAHEYGHHIQNLYPSTMPKLGMGTTANKAKEWQADCYSGAAMHWMGSGPAFAGIDHSGLLVQAASSGDSGIDGPDGYSHGTPTERSTAWDAGWQANTAATCVTRTY